MSGISTDTNRFEYRSRKLSLVWNTITIFDGSSGDGSQLAMTVLPPPLSMVACWVFKVSIAASYFATGLGGITAGSWTRAAGSGSGQGCSLSGSVAANGGSGCGPIAGSGSAAASAAGAVRDKANADCTAPGWGRGAPPIRSIEGL